MKITLNNLCKYFVGKDKKVVKAVDNMNLVIPSGKLIALLGPSGCGKSTTLYMIAGLHTPTSGEIYFGEDEVTQVPPEKRGIGLVFQNYALYPHLTVRQNIQFPLENIKTPKDEKEVIVQEMASLVDITQYLDRKPSELSGGQQQRVAIARALAKKPRVLLLDEPLSNLDARLRLQTREEIRRIQKETGITTIFVTHDQEEAMSISDEIVVMREGVIQQIGKPQDVYNAPANLFVAKFLGTPQINVFDATLDGNKVSIGGVFNEEVYEDGYKTYTFVEGNLFHVTDIKLEKKAAKDVKEKAFVAIRPEGFVIESISKYDGTEVKQSADEAKRCLIKTVVDHVETIGRDTTLICHNPAGTNTFKVIIPSEIIVNENDLVTLSIKPHKMFVFDSEGDLI